MTSSSGSGRRGRISSVSHAAAISRAQLLDRLRPLRHGQVRAIQPHQRVRDLQVLVDQRAPGDLGRVRGEHELDPQRARGLVERVGVDAAGDQPRERLFARRRLRAGSRIALVVAPPPHAMVLLGDVGQRQEVGERPRDGQRRLHRQVPQHAGERVDIVGGTARRACFDSARTRSTVSKSACPSRSRSVSPSSSPSIRTSSRSGAWGSMGDRIISRRSSVGGRAVAESAVAVGSRKSAVALERRMPTAERRSHFTL